MSGLDIGLPSRLAAPPRLTGSVKLNLSGPGWLSIDLYDWIHMDIHGYTWLADQADNGWPQTGWLVGGWPMAGHWLLYLGGPDGMVISASLEMGGYGWLSIDVSGQVDIAVYNWYDFPWLAMDSPDWLPMLANDWPLNGWIWQNTSSNNHGPSDLANCQSCLWGNWYKHWPGSSRMGRIWLDNEPAHTNPDKNA